LAPDSSHHCIITLRNSALLLSEAAIAVFRLADRLPHDIVAHEAMLNGSCLFSGR
jgi:hypothetical protein